jgi:hypothetical protein
MKQFILGFLATFAVVFCGLGVAAQGEHGATTNHPANSSGDVQRLPDLPSSTSPSNRIAAPNIRAVELPSMFLKTWYIKCTKQKFDVQPQFEADCKGLPYLGGDTVWTITPDQNSNQYKIFSDADYSVELWVDKVQGQTAFLRFKQVIDAFLIQEAVVMTVSTDGRQFNGLRRLTVCKGNSVPMAKAHYQLSGSLDKDAAFKSPQ